MPKHLACMKINNRHVKDSLISLVSKQDVSRWGNARLYCDKLFVIMRFMSFHKALATISADFYELDLGIVI